MKYSHGHDRLLALALAVSLIFAFSGCSKGPDPAPAAPKADAPAPAPAQAAGMNELKQIYLVFIDEFTLKPFGQENEERYSPNQAVASKAIGELEGVSGSIRDAKAQETCNKFLGLLREYNDAAPVLEGAIRDTKSAREDLNRREEEAKANASADPFKYAAQKQEILKERSKLADYGNIGIKKSKVESIETALYWLHKDFGIQGLKK